MVAGPQVPTHNTRGNIKHFTIDFGKRANGPLHVTILTVLFSEPWLVEIVPPFVERLCLFPDDPWSVGMTVSASSRGTHVGIENTLVRGGDAVGPSNSSVRRHVTTRACHADRLADR